MNICSAFTFEAGLNPLPVFKDVARVQLRIMFLWNDGLKLRFYKPFLWCRPRRKCIGSVQQLGLIYVAAQQTFNCFGVGGNVAAQQHIGGYVFLMVMSSLDWNSHTKFPKLSTVASRVAFLTRLAPQQILPARHSLPAMFRWWRTQHNLLQSALSTFAVTSSFPGYEFIETSLTCGLRHWNYQQKAYRWFNR